MKMNRLLLSVLGAVVALVVTLVGAGSAQAFDPIEGVWAPSTHPSDHYLFVETSGVVRSYIITGDPPGTCPPGDANHFIYIVGYRADTLSRVGQVGTDSTYTGSDGFYAAFTCQYVGEGQETATLSFADPGQPTLRRCVAPPGAGAPQIDPNTGQAINGTGCETDLRVAPPKPEPTPGNDFTYGQLQGPQHGCLQKRRVRVHFLDRSNDPLVSAQVALNGRLIKSLTYPNVERPFVVVLPKGFYRLKIAATTASGLRLTKTRTFRTCVHR